jgi:NADH dehydrogenase FAD-containing subunit
MTTTVVVVGGGYAGVLAANGDVARTIAFVTSDDCGTTTGHYAPVHTGLATH